MFQKILCAVDLEEGTENVVKTAADLASRYQNSQLIIAYVAEMPLLTLGGGKGKLELPEEDLMAVDKAAAKLRKMARERIEDLVHILDIPAKVVIAEGPPVAGSILKLIRELRPNLLVLGSHKKGPISRLLLGSTSDKLAHEAPCPVLIVKDTPTDSAAERTRRMPQSGGGL